MAPRYKLRDLSMPSPRLTWQGAALIASVFSGVWLLFVLTLRIILHWG